MWVEAIKQCDDLYGRWHYSLCWWKAACILQLLSKLYMPSISFIALAKSLSVIVGGRLCEK